MRSLAYLIRQPIPIHQPKQPRQQGILKPAQPNAIVIVLVHWLTPDFETTVTPNPDLIYDHYGFLPSTYELKYPAPSDLNLAQQITGYINKAGLKSSLDQKRGFDHGVFIPLKVMFPNANLLVVQLSRRQDLGAAAHIKVGQDIACLREQVVLIIASGMSFHNMCGYGDPHFTPVSIKFDDWLTTAVAAGSNMGIKDYIEMVMATQLSGSRFA